MYVCVCVCVCVCFTSVHRQGILGLFGSVSFVRSSSQTACVNVFEFDSHSGSKTCFLHLI